MRFRSSSKPLLCYMYLIVALTSEVSQQMPLSSTGRECICRQKSRGCTVNDRYVMNHRQAFGTDWACLPASVKVNHKVCYRTIIGDCKDENGPQCILKERKHVNLDCDPDILPLTVGEPTILFMKSPRYNCTGNSNGRLQNYRNRDFCIYNISIPNYEKQPCKRIQIRTFQEHMDIQPRDDLNKCVDYLEFDFGAEIGTRKHCANDIINETVFVSQFTAVFWTDRHMTYRGFEVSVTCLDEYGASSGAGA